MKVAWITKSNRSHRGKRIEQIAGGLVIESYVSIGKAAKAVNGNPTNIKRAMAKSGTAYGYSWRLTGEVK